MILETFDWKEYHPNGNIWISGTLGLVAPIARHLYDTRNMFKGYEGKDMCRLGLWKKYFENGQLAWTLDFGDGTHDYKSKEKFPSYRECGELIIR